MTAAFLHPQRPLKVVVIGAGLGGLTAALALRHIGADVRVFERMPFAPAGDAGIALWANALRVLDALGFGGRIRAAAQPIDALCVRSHRGYVLRRTPLDRFAGPLGPACVVLRRTALQRLLREALPADAVLPGVECNYLKENTRGVVVRFAGHAPMEADLLVGADGFASIVRRHLWGDTPIRYSGQTCYRGIAPGATIARGEWHEFHGPGLRLGCSPVGPSSRYWYVGVNAPAGTAEDLRGAKGALLAQAARWPREISTAIAATPPEAITRHDLCDRPPLRQWSRGRLTLVGDAAHPLLLEFGHDVGLAIEDAAVLAHALAGEAHVPQALRNYDAVRIPRLTQLTDHAWRAGARASWTHPLAVAVRELLYALPPAACARRALARHAAFDARAAELPRRAASDAPSPRELSLLP